MHAFLDYTFKNKALYDEALTHASSSGHISYERLEFLGDRVLGLIIAEELYKRFPKEAEGDLAKRLAALVEGSMLAQIARSLDLGKYIKFSDGERMAGGADNDNILADVFESIIGAMFLDGGIDPCRAFLLAAYEDIFNTAKEPPRHPKTIVQEWAQGQGIALPVYTIIDRSGPDHAPLFTVEIRVQGYPAVTARAASRQAAEKEVAVSFAHENNLVT